MLEFFNGFPLFNTGIQSPCLTSDLRFCIGVNEYHSSRRPNSNFAHSLYFHCLNIFLEKYQFAVDGFVLG